MAQQGYVVMPDGRYVLYDQIPDDVEMESVVLPEISPDAETQSHYVRLRLRGESHNIAAICALRRPPQAVTDREFRSGTWNNGGFDTEAQGAYYRQVAQSEGKDVTGCVYLSQLADYPGDPRAFVRDRAEVKEVCLERGFACDGVVKVRGSERPGPAPVKVAPELISREVEERLAENPTLDRHALTEEVYQLRSGAVDLNPTLRVREDGPTEEEVFGDDPHLG